MDTRILFLFHITYYVTFPGSRAPARIGGPFAITSRVLRASDSHILFSWVGFFVLFDCKISPKKQLIRTSERNLSSLVLNALTFALRARRTNRWHAYLHTMYTRPQCKEADRAFRTNHNQLLLVLTVRNSVMFRDTN